MDSARADHSSASERLVANVFAPVDISFLVYLRIIFGGIMLWEVCRYFAYGWIARFYIQPELHFTYFGFGWIKPWPGPGMFLHFFALGLCAVCIIAGCFYRVAAALFFIGFTYVFLLDQVYYLNHFYLISLFSLLLVFVPAERAFSIDAWRRPRLRSEVAPAWTLWLMRFQIGLPYLYGGIAKLGEDWLRGEPMRMWLRDRMDFPLIGQFFDQEWAVYFFVIGGLLLDLLIVPMLLWRRTRLLGVLSVGAFHLLNSQLFRIGIFPWFMLATTLVFFAPDTPRRLVRRMLGRDEISGAIRESKPWSCSALGRRLTMGFLMVHVLMQVLVPLRHWLYPGDVNWTEEGHRFSWHMKLRSKSGDAEFTVSDLNTGRRWIVDPRDFLTRRQFEKMATHPDMILQFSHHLAELKSREGYADVEVRARVMASLNGRKPQLLVDPSVDLAGEPRTLAPARWILPLTEPLRPRSEVLHAAR